MIRCIQIQRMPYLTSDDQSDSTTSGARGCLKEMIPAGRSIFTYIPTAPVLPCPTAPAPFQ